MSTIYHNYSTSAPDWGLGCGSLQTNFRQNLLHHPQAHGRCGEMWGGEEGGEVYKEGAQCSSHLPDVILTSMG